MDPTSTSENGRQSRGLARFWPVHGMPVPAQRQSEEDGPSVRADDGRAQPPDTGRPTGDPSAPEPSYSPVPYDTSLYRPPYDPAATGPVAADPVDPAGDDPAGSDPAGQSTADQSTAGQHGTDQNAGSQNTGSQNTGAQNTAGRHPVAQPFVVQPFVVQSFAAQAPVTPGPTAYDPAPYDAASRDQAAYEPTVRGSSGYDSAAQDSAAPVREAGAAVPPSPVTPPQVYVPPPYAVAPAPGQPPYAPTPRTLPQPPVDHGIATLDDETAGRYAASRAVSALQPDVSGRDTGGGYDRTPPPEVTGDTEMVALGNRRGGHTPDRTLDDRPLDDRPLPDNVTPLRSWTVSQAGYAADPGAPGRNGDGNPRHGSAGRVHAGPGGNGAPDTAPDPTGTSVPTFPQAGVSGTGASESMSPLSGMPLGSRPSGFATPAPDLPATPASGLASVRSPFTGTAPATPSPYSPLTHPSMSGHRPAWTSDPSGLPRSGSAPSDYPSDLRSPDARTPEPGSSQPEPSEPGSPEPGLSEPGLSGLSLSGLSLSGRSTSTDPMPGAFVPTGNRESPSASPTALPVPAQVSAPAPAPAGGYLPSAGGSGGWAPTPLDAPSVTDRRGDAVRTVVPERGDAVGRAEARWAGTVPDSIPTGAGAPASAPAIAPAIAPAGAPAVPATDDAPATGRRSRVDDSPASDDDAGASLRPGDVAQTRITLWDDEATRQFHDEWHEVKAQFVDDPVAALTRAHDLLTEAVHELTDALLAERDDLDPLRRTSAPDTESMRMAMRGYREFLDRILAL